MKLALKHFGVNSEVIDPRVVLLDGKHDDATYLRESDKRIRQAVGEKKGNILLASGFIGYNRLGEELVFKRNGSDLTQTLYMRALNADAGYNWTDTNGLMPIDPRILTIDERQDLHHIPLISHESMMEFSGFGAKLHAKCVGPLVDSNIPLYVGNTGNYNGPKTKIQNPLIGYKGVMAVGIIPSSTVINLWNADMEDRSGEFANFAEAFRNINVNMISSSTVEMSASVRGPQEKDDFDSYNNSIADINKGLMGLGEVKTDSRKSILGIIGENLGKNPYAISKVFSVLANEDIHIGQITKSGDYSIGISVSAEKANDAARAIYFNIIKNDQKRFLAGMNRNGYH
jgi:aspartate kinase